MQNATCGAHLDPNSELHQTILSTQIAKRSGNGSPETRFAYLDGRAPMFDTVPFCSAITAGRRRLRALQWHGWALSAGSALSVRWTNTTTAAGANPASAGV